MNCVWNFFLAVSFLLLWPFPSEVVGQELVAKKGVEEALYEIGERLNCYFTLEELFDEKSDEEPIRFAEIEDLSSIRSIDSFVLLLRKQLRDVTVSRDSNRPNVVHLIDNRLRKLPNYSLDRKVSLQVRGKLSDLEAAITEKFPDVLPPRFLPIIGGIAWGSDRNTPCDIDIKNGTLRDAMTAAIPVSGYSRVAFIVETRKVNMQWESWFEYQWDAETKEKIIREVEEREKKRRDAN